MSLLLTLGLGGSGTPPTPPSGGDTPYMNLLLPTVSVTLGPLYATEVNQAFLRVDSHDHSDGYGKLVGTNGLNINADLSFHGFSARNIDAAGFNIQSPTAGLTGDVYFSGQDLYCVDGAGNIIQITAAGAVNVSGLGSWTGLIAPAQAGYSSVTKKFSLKSNTTGPKFGLLEIGDIFLFPGDPNLGTLPYIRLATPTAGVTSYTWQFPPAVPAGTGKAKLLSLNNDGTVTLGPATLPSVTSFVRMDSNGVPYADVTVDTGTMQLAGSGPYVLGVKPQGINTAQIANRAVTATQLSAPNLGTAAVNFFGTDVHTTAFSLTFQTGPSPYGASNARPILVVFGPTPATTSGMSGGTDAVTIEVLVGGSSSNRGGAKFLVDLTSSPAVNQAGCFFNYVIPPGTIASGAHTWQFKATSAAGIGLAGTFSVTEL